MLRIHALDLIEKRLLNGESKKWCYDLCKVWDVEFKEAVFHGHVEIAKLLIEADDTLGEKWSPTLLLLESIRTKQSYAGSAKWLIDLGADIHCNMNLCVRQAAEYGDTETVKVLLEAGARPFRSDSNNWKGLIRYAAKHEHHDTVKVISDWVNAHI